jgi:HEPN domain-containing protein
MKGMKSVILLIVIMALIAIGADTASAAVNVFVNATMPYDVLYQGQMVSANVTVKNNENFPVRVYSIGVHYDWMPENMYSSVDFGGDYVQVESNGLTMPGQLLILCDNNVSTGYHSFFYKVQLNWYNSYTATWMNETVVQPGTIFVESPLKPQALQELQFANRTLSDARSVNYTSKRALDDIKGATDYLNDGWSAYNTNEYPRAINDSLQVVAFVGDAKISEKNYKDNVSEIERIVLSVNDKLRTVSSTSDPDTKGAIAAARENLNKTGQYISAEDFMTALTYAHLADKSAEDAIQKQFYYSLKANETEAAKGKARIALDNAQASLDNASNMTSTSAQNILRDARIKMGNATVAFDRGDYANATIEANVISSLVLQADSDEAGHRMMLARNKIASVGELKSPEAKGMLDNASRLYNQSESEFNAKNYKDCILHADSALKLAENATAADQKWRDENPLSAVTPGFGALVALLAIGVIFMLKERKD